MKNATKKAWALFDTTLTPRSSKKVRETHKSPARLQMSENCRSFYLQLTKQRRFPLTFWNFESPHPHSLLTGRRWAGLSGEKG